MLRRVPVLILVVLLFGWVVAAAQEGCVGEPECYEIPPEPAPVLSNWPGDDRLNPVADEYYTVYCNYDLVRIWAGLPSSQEIASIPILNLLTGPFPLDGGNGISIARVDDIMTISGTNGNGPVHPGSKSFSLLQCIERNGGVPEAENTNNEDITVPAPIFSHVEIIQIAGIDCTVNVYSDGSRDEPICEGLIGEQPPDDASILVCLFLSTPEAVGRCMNRRLPSGTPLAAAVRWFLIVVCQIPLLLLGILSVPGSVLLRRIQRRHKYKTPSEVAH